VKPKTITLCDCNLWGGVIIVKLADGQDYILKDPVILHHRVEIVGGHNVVWIGGDIRPTSWIGIGAIKLQHVGVGGGTVHLEGIYIGGVLDDAIEGGEYANLSKPSGTLADATLQVENIRAGPLSGDSKLEHQDCIQQYGGWRDLRVDHFTCRSPFQGFYLPWEDGASNNQGVLSHWDIRNANLYDLSPSSGSTFQTLIHFGDKNGNFDATTHKQRGNLSNVYLDATQRTCNQETYPNSGTTSTGGIAVHSTVNSAGTITWASTWAIPGHVTPGVPPGGDYVPSGVAGLGYISPGYK
jgi:hypothetical protein